MPLTQQEIDRRHTYHPPRNDADAGDHQHIRDRIKVLALEVEDLFEHSSARNAVREQALFHTKLEEASFWAHAALARGRS